MEEVERDCITPDFLCPDEFSHIGYYREPWEHMLRILTYLPVSRALQSSGCSPWGPSATWQEKGK